MSWFTKLFPSEEQAAFVMSDAPLSSPFATAQLSRVVLADLLGTDSGIVTRADAMEIPAVVRARDLICNTLSRYPLTLWKPNQDDPSGDTDIQLPTPAWLQSTATGQSPLLRVLWSLDDLFFSSLSLWAVERGDGDEITDALRVDPAEWSVDPDSRGVLVRGEPVTDPRSVILFEGTRDPLLTTARKQIRASQDLANAWQQRLKSPVPLVALKQTEANSELTSDEVDDLVLDWETARRESGTGFVPYGFDAVAMGVVAPDLYIAGRNADRLDWANLTGVPASLLEGSTSTASLTYSTAEGKRGELVDYSLSAWALPFEARLSQDDVTPPGTYVRFDLHWLTNPVQPGRNPGSED